MLCCFYNEAWSKLTCGEVVFIVVANQPRWSVHDRQGDHSGMVIKRGSTITLTHPHDPPFPSLQVFKGVEYVSFMSLSHNVPILSCGGISKRFMVPGWRLGWIKIIDRGGAFEKEVRPGLSRLAMKLLGPCSLIQAALPHMFNHTPKEYFDRNMEIFRRNAELVYEGLKNAAGCSPVMPAGTMYMMVSERVGLHACIMMWPWTSKCMMMSEWVGLLA